MAYRDQEAALRERKALLERERARWAEEAAELETALREIGERVGALDVLWSALGIRFRRSPEIPWRDEETS